MIDTIKTPYLIRHVRIALACCMVIFSTFLQAQWKELNKVVASDRGDGDLYGNSVSISGDYAIVGAYAEDEDADGNNTLSNSGSAYIFKNDGNGNWIQIQKITASDREADDVFGWSVSISGNYAIVGAWGEDEDADGNNTLSTSGSAYIFKNDGNDNWIQIQKIVADDRETNDIFGSEVSISGNYAIVGAYAEEEDSNGDNTMAISGSAYIFKNDGSDNWTQIQKITASDRSIADQFGWSVSISGDYAIVGAIAEDHDADGNNVLSASGSAYIFKNDGNDNWTQTQKIIASDRSNYDNFGYSVYISGNYTVIGAPFEDDDADGNNALSRSGSVYIFKNDGSDNWTQIQKIVADDREAGDDFGSAVVISGEYALVGADGESEDADGNNTLAKSGSAYIFKNDGSDNWSQTNKIVASDRGEDDRFGGGWVSSIGIDNNRFIVGASQEDEDEDGNNTLSNSGSAYIFQYKDSQSIDFAAIDTKKYGNSFELPATTDAGLTISYRSEDQAIATTSDNTINAVGLGNTTITASQEGNEDYWEADQVMQNLTIEKAALTVTADNKSKTYGEANPALTLSYAGFVNGEDKTNLNTEPAPGTEADESSNAGSYPITVSGGEATNYDLFYVNGLLTVNKATLTATAADYSLNEGESFPASFDISYTGFVLSEDAGVIDTPPVAAPDANDTSVPGSYSITVSGGEDNNYEFAYVDGVLTVNEVLSILKENTITIYPNPATDLLSIGSAEVEEVEIFDMNGKLILSSGAKKIDVSGLEAATYILKLKDAEGKVLSSNRIVKQ